MLGNRGHEVVVYVNGGLIPERVLCTEVEASTLR